MQKDHTCTGFSAVLTPSTRNLALSTHLISTRLSLQLTEIIPVIDGFLHKKRLREN